MSATVRKWDAELKPSDTRNLAPKCKEILVVLFNVPFLAD